MAHEGPDHTGGRHHGGHQHGDAPPKDAKSAVGIAALLTGGFMLAEVAGGLVAGPDARLPGASCASI